MPLVSPRPKKMGHEQPVRQATGISFDLKVDGKSLQAQAIFAKTASTGFQRVGVGWKNLDAHDTQLQLGKSAGPGCRHQQCHPCAGRCPFSTSFTTCLFSLLLLRSGSLGGQLPCSAITELHEAGRNIGPSKPRITLAPAISKRSLKFLPIPSALEVLLHTTSYT